PIASRRSATARRNHSATSTRKGAGSRTVVLTSCIRNRSSRAAGVGVGCPSLPMAGTRSQVAARSGAGNLQHATFVTKAGHSGNFWHPTELTMKIQPSFTIRPLTTVVLFAAYWLSATPAWGANKEMVQLQTQVQQLQEQMSRMQQAFDERMGVMKNLVEHDTDAVNKVSAALANLQATLEKQQADSGGRTDQVSGQIQALNDTMDELKVRLTKLSKQ